MKEEKWAVQRMGANRWEDECVSNCYMTVADWFQAQQVNHPENKYRMIKRVDTVIDPQCRVILCGGDTPIIPGSRYAFD